MLCLDNRIVEESAFFFFVSKYRQCFSENRIGSQSHVNKASRKQTSK